MSGDLHRPSALMPHGLGAIVANPLPAKQQKLPRLRTVGRYVLLRPEYRDEQTAGGIFIPQDSKEKNIAYEATIVSAATHYRTAKGALVPSGLEAGQRVLYYRFDAKRCWFNDGARVDAVPFDSIVGVIE